MNYRGVPGFYVSEVSIGCYALSGVYGKKNPEEFSRMLRRAYDLGVNFFDTADQYGPEAETLLGRATKPFRKSIYITTKVGLTPQGGRDLSRAYVHEACARSLKRLGTDYIDIYQVHFDDPHTPVAETVAAMEELKKEGLIINYGIGHLPPERVQEYLNCGRPFSMLMELSAVSRGARERYLPLIRKEGLLGIAFSTTGRGLLTGKIRAGHHFPAGDMRRFDPLFQRENFLSGLRVTERLQQLALQYKKTPVQCAIAWVLAQPGIVTALTGPSTVDHLEENIAASGCIISQDDLAALDQFFCQEEQRAKEERGEAVHKILNEPLPAGKMQALADLVYAAENLVELGWVAEEFVFPHIRPLLSCEGKENDEAFTIMKSVQAEFRKLLG